MIANDYSVLKPVPTYQTTALAPAMGGVTSFVQPRTIGTTLNGVNPMAGTLTGGTSGLPVFSNTVAGFANNTMGTGGTVPLLYANSPTTTPVTGFPIQAQGIDYTGGSLQQPLAVAPTPAIVSSVDPSLSAYGGLGSGLGSLAGTPIAAIAPRSSLPTLPSADASIATTSTPANDTTSKLLLSLVESLTKTNASVQPRQGVSNEHVLDNIKMLREEIKQTPILVKRDDKSLNETGKSFSSSTPSSVLKDPKSQESKKLAESEDSKESETV